MKASRKSSESEMESLLANVTDEFVSAVQQGDQPDIETFARRHPRIADSIRSLFPALLTLHRSQHESSSWDRPFERMGEFRVLEEIGRGGMGVVFRAEQPSLGRFVALKVLPISALMDDQQLNRFKNEARAAATLNHPNIVPIYSVGVEQGAHFYAMQLIEGETLAEVIHRLSSEATTDGSLQKEMDLCSQSASLESTSKYVQDKTRGRMVRPSPRQTSLVLRSKRGGTETNHEFYRHVAHLGQQAALALEHAHSHGVLHRDIKPANLLVNGAGHLWITDFGVARLESDASMTVTGDLLGTIRYMSPEQALGNRLVDQRSDVYSLGVTLYETLTLQPALHGEDRLGLLQKIANDEPTRPRRIRADIPQDLETIVLKAIEKEAADRYPSASAMAADLQCFLDNRPISARPPALVDRLGKWSRRHQTVVWSSLAIMAIGLVLLAASTILIGNANRENRRQRKLAEANLKAALEVIEDGYAKEVTLLKHEPGMTEKQRDFLTAIVAFYARLPDEAMVQDAGCY